MRAPDQHVERQRRKQQHAVDSHQQRQTQRHPEEGPEAGRRALFPVRERQQRHEDQELRDGFRDRVAGEPDLHDVRGEEQGGQQRRGVAEQAAQRKEDAQRAEDPKDRRCRERTSHAHGLEQEGPEGGEQVEELGEDAARLRALQGEPHEAAPVEVGTRGVAIEQLDVLLRDRQDGRVGVGDAARARDQAHRADVGAGIAPAQQVLARPSLQAKGEQQHDQGGSGIRQPSQGAGTVPRAGASRRPAPRGSPRRGSRPR